MSSSFRSLAQFLVHGSRKKEADPLVFALETGSQDTGSKMFILYAGGGVYAVPAVMVYGGLVYGRSGRRAILSKKVAPVR